LSGGARQKLKKAKARASEAKTGGTQQPGNETVPKQEKTSIETPKRPWSENSTPKKLLDLQKGPGNFKEALTNTKIAIFKETYAEDKLTE
jgi:hypothetical protein